MPIQSINQNSKLEFDRDFDYDCKCDRGCDQIVAMTLIVTDHSFLTVVAD